MTGEELTGRLDHLLAPAWRDCTVEALIRKTLYEDYGLNLSVLKGAGNTNRAVFLVSQKGKSLTLYISNKYSPCGKKQMAYLFLEYLITGKLGEVCRHPLFIIGSDNKIFSNSQLPVVLEMNDNLPLASNAELLRDILNRKAAVF